MCADIRRARAKLGYRPQVTLREGLARTIAKDPRLQPVPIE
jgi:nucleoside-diphosphate-sugar epimerase